MKAGGEKYARLCALAYRQCLAANKLAADANGQPLLFPKENFSNGCIATVDVIYPMEPLFLLFSPALTKATLTPILDYASSGRWRFLSLRMISGLIPKPMARCAAAARKRKRIRCRWRNRQYALAPGGAGQDRRQRRVRGAYWPVLEKWAAYLKSKGFDPENQLCTDDFAGHLAHNVNLSAKAILALGAYGALCEMRGGPRPGRGLSQAGARAGWPMDTTGRRRRPLSPGLRQTRNLEPEIQSGLGQDSGLGAFPRRVAQKEMAFYRKTQNRFGLPLDNRQAYTKLDWTLWTATLTNRRTTLRRCSRPSMISSTKRRTACQ